MAWIKSIPTIEKHPKALAFKKSQNWNINETIGFLHRFWYWVLDYAETGNLTEFSNEIIAESLGCSIETIAALYTHGFIDEDKKVHDWLNYSGKYLWAKYHETNPRYYKSIVKVYRLSYSCPKSVLSLSRIRERKGRERKGKEGKGLVGDYQGEKEATTGKQYLTFHRFVKLTQEEYDNLKTKIGEKELERLILSLDVWLEKETKIKDNPHRDDNLRIQTWFNNDQKKNNPKGGTHKYDKFE